MAELIADFAELLGDYLLDSAERLSGLERALLDIDEAVGARREKIMRDIRRELHTMKGNAAMMGLGELQRLAHRMEEIVAAHDQTLRAALLLPDVDRFRQLTHALTSAPADGADAERTADAQGLSSGGIRVSFAVLDQLLDQVGETVILQNRLSNAIAQRDWERVATSHAVLSRALGGLRDGVMGLRLTPLQLLFASLRRIVHDEAEREGKIAVLEAAGGSTPLDKALLDVAGEALGHLVRNAVIHGLESTAERIAKGKNPTGTIRVTATAHAEEVRIEVSDDGGGIDPVKLRSVAMKRGVQLPPDLYSVLFEPGFTTRTQADLSAGRGVGLSAVREAVRKQNGEVVVLSELHRGTTFRMDLPMSVSITRALLVEVDAELYALPLTAIVDIQRVSGQHHHQLNGAGVLKWRGEVLTLLDTGCHFGTADAPRAQGYAVVITGGGKRRGLVVDALHGLNEIVVRGLDRIVGRPVGVAGTTVLGNGRPVLILDPRALVNADPFNHRAA